MSAINIFRIFRTRTLRLQVSIDKAHKMQILKCCCNLGCVKSCIFLTNAFVGSCLKCTKELSSTAIFHTQIEMVFRLKRVVQCDDERVVARGQNLLLRECTLYLISLDHFFLAED